MTSHSSLQLPRPPSAATKKPAGRVEEAIESFNALLQLPVVSRARFLPSSSTEGAPQNNLVLDTSHRSLSALSKRSASQTLGLGHDGSVQFASPLVFTSPDVKHASFSPDGKVQAIFRALAGKDGKGEKKFVEIWSVQEGARLEELEVTAEHGDWYFDSTFGPVSWHPDGQSLVYVAEAPKPKSDGALPQQASFEYTPDFGETFTGRRSPSLFLLLLPSSSFQSAVSSSSSSPSPTIHRLTSSADFPSIDYGQPVFLPDNLDGTPRLLATGYSRLGDGRKLGVVYCANRPAQIYEFTLSVVPKSAADSSLTWRALSATSQSDPSRSSRSPRVLHPPPGARFAPLVVWLSNPVGGPHSSCAELHAAVLQKDGSAQMAVLVPTVSKPKNLAAFPGLYVDQLPLVCFVVTEDGSPAVVMTSIWRSRKVPLLVSLKTGEVQSLLSWPEPNEDDVVLPYLGREAELESLTVLGTDGGGRVVGLRSSLKSPPVVVLADVARGVEVEWKLVKKPVLPREVSGAFSSLSYTVAPLPKFDASELILLSPIPIDPAAPASPNLPPLITIPHGGPHSTTATEWSAGVTALALAGFRVCLMNYPGSLGYGQDFVDVLPPKLGALEVEATLAAGHYLNTLSLASRTKGKKFLSGGSHGGFILGHLTARFPDEFDAAVMRNPVTDMSALPLSSDIPDWAYTEATLPYSLSHPPTFVSADAFTQLSAISPLQHIRAEQKVPPTLLLIGDGDRRVPPDQARAWYHALKGNGSEVDMLVFPGNGHALDSTVECEVVSFAAGLRWLGKFAEF